MKESGSAMLHRLLHELLVVAIIVLAVTTLKKLHVLDPLERLVLDTFAATEPNRPAERTVIFDVDEESYRSAHFNSTSPLNTETLAILIAGAMKKDFQARAVVVDVITNPAAVRDDLRTLDPKLLESPVPVVWARDAERCRSGRLDCIRTLPASHGVPDGVEVLPAGQSRGIALLPVDADGVIRRYFPTFRIAPPTACECDEQDADLEDSLPRAAVRAVDHPVRPPSEEPLVLNWRGDRYAVPRIPATLVIEGWRQEWWGRAQPIKDRIVLIGGTFRAGRDSKWTPAGEMAGVEIMAQLVELELAGGGLRHRLLVGILLEIVLGMVLAMLNWRFPAETRTSLVVNGTAVLVLPVLLSWLLHRYAVYWISLAPVLAGVWLHQWHARARYLSRLVRRATAPH